MATIPKLNLPQKSAATALFDAASIIESLAPKNHYFEAKVREMRKIASEAVDRTHAIAEVLDYCDDMERNSENDSEARSYGAPLSSKRVRQILRKAVR